MTPGQNAIMVKISVTEGQLNKLIKKRDFGYAEKGDDREIDKLIQILESERQKLRTLQLTVARQRRYRQRQRQMKLERIAATNPGARGPLLRGRGRPPKDPQFDESASSRGGWSWGDFVKKSGSDSSAGSTGEPVP